ncbi:hypothetical protein [Pelagerythrobacter marinus]|uniref:hypothetical protein n=1 Tax=Pelagerythrobacter marinus TaxID=538382 RepID=UPI002AC9484C|nr:hypothetical protein [Pelagerythrobacter marinus]WPZ05476.1 hypothetical protein T8T98_08525 [Pelagerythrobacter marinus]
MSDTSIALVQRAGMVVQELPLSDRTAGIVGLLGLLIINIARTSPSDQAEAAEQIVKLMRE